MKKLKKLYKITAFLLVQAVLLMDGFYLSQIAYSRPEQLSPALQISSKDFQQNIRIAEDRNKLLKILDKIPLLELTSKDIPPSLYQKFIKIKQAVGEQGGDAVSFMLRYLGFGERINLWRKADHEKAVRVMNERIIPFLQKNRFVSDEDGFAPVALVDEEAGADEYTLEELIERGDLYFTRFLDTDFSDAVYKKLGIKTSGLAATVAGNALSFGEIVEEATQGRVKAEQVVRAYYRRQLLPRFEEIYKYSGYLHSLYKQKRQRDRLDNIVACYEANKDAESFSIDEELIADINKTHKYLIDKLPDPEFLTYVKDILSLRNWLKETGSLSGEEITLLENSLDGFWPEAKGNSATIREMLENHSAWIKDFHAKHVKPVLDFLNARLWRWRGRRLKNEKDYLRLLQRSAGWFSALGIADWLKNENYGREQNSTTTVKILDMDSFFSGCFRSIIKKEEALPAGVQIIDLVTNKLGKRFGKNPKKVKISTSSYWPFRAESVDFITSIFHLHELTSAELFMVFKQAGDTLRPGGSFVITVPFDQYIPPEGIRVLAAMGLKLRFESVSCQKVKNPSRLSRKGNPEAISESVSKRKFYLLILEKQKPVKETWFADISEADKQNLRFIEAPSTDAGGRTEKRMRLKKQQEIDLNYLSENIEDIEAANLRLTALYHRLPADLDFDEDTFRIMIRNIIDYQYVLYEYFMELEMEDNFDILEKLVEDYKDVVEKGGFSLEDLTVSDRENILEFHAYLESIFIVLKDTPNFSKVLKSAFAFKENNRDFLEPADIALIEEAEKIWNSQIIQGKNIDFERIKSVFYRMIELDKKIAVIEEELARLLLKWGADEKIKDRLRGQSFWPVIESSAGWEALQYFTSAYGKGLEMAPKIYVCNADPLLKKIIGKAMAEKKLKVDIEDFPREQEQTAKLQGSGYYVLSVFDYAENGDESLIEPQLLNIRELLHKQGRFIIILAREQDKNGFRQALRNFGFNIRTTYRNGDTGFHLIETDKGGKIEDSMIRFNKLKGKSDFTPEDEEFLRRFWENVFKREGIFLAANFKGVLQNYITALPADVNFRMMFEQLEQRLAAEDVTKNNFISLRKMEEFLDTLIGKTPALKCSLYDRIGDDGRLIEGLLMRTTPEGKKINWILELEENRFYRQLFKLGDKIENFQINDAGVYKGYEDNSKNHQEKVISNMMDGVFSLLQHLDQMNELHMGLLNDAIDVKKVKAEIEAKFEDWFLCAEKELPSKYRDMMNYLWHGNSLLKGTVFSIIADIWMLQGGVDSEIGKRLGEFSKFADEYKKVSWETMEPKISEALSVLFLLNLWLDYEQKNDLLNLFIRFRIDRFVNEIEDEIGGDSYGARSLAFDLPHARNTPKQKIVFSLLGDNEPDKLFFQNRLIKVFNLSNQVFTFESIYNLQWMMNFNGHEREIYLELLGRITGYFRQKAKMQPDSWRKKAAILDKYINIFVRDAKGKAMIARGRNNPLSKEGADKAIEEEKRLDFIQAMEEEMEASNIHYAIEPEELSKIIATESSLVTLDLLRYLIGLSHKNIDLEDKVKIKNSIKGAIDKINSNFVLVSLMIDAKENAWIRSYIAERIIPDKNFRIVVEMICGDGDCSALLIEKNLAARRAIIQILNSGHNEEMIPTVSMIRTYLICDKTSKSLEFLREIWEAFSRKNGRLFQLDGVIRFLFLLEGEDLPEAVLRKSAEIISDVFEKQKDSYTAQEAQELSITVNKILGMIETRITLLSQEEELGYLPERTIIKETVFVDRAI